MPRPITLFTGQWADVPLDTLAQKAKKFGYDGLELACWGDHFDVTAAQKKDYCDGRHALLAKHGLKTWAISAHLVGQAICDPIDERHKAILPPHVWGDGKPKEVQKRAAEEMIKTAHAAKNLGVGVRQRLYRFEDLAAALTASRRSSIRKSRTASPISPRRWNPILDEFKKAGVKFALEVHPTEIAFDIVSAERALDALKHRPEFGFQLRSLAPRLPGRRLREVHHEVQQPHLPCAHEGRLLVDPADRGRRLWRPHQVRRCAPLLGVPLARPRRA